MAFYFQEVKTLIGKELTLEWRQLIAFNGIILYLVSTVFVSYLSFEGMIDLRTWNALFWIILLFASVNAILKGFVQETEGRMIYYYTVVSPQAVIASKIIYNALFMMVLSLIAMLIYMGFMGNPVQNIELFTVNMILGVTGFSSVMSLVSAIVSRIRNNFTLMGILSFPLVLPLLLVLMKVSFASLSGDGIREHTGNLLVLLLLTFITFILSVVLFPYIWRE